MNQKGQPTTLQERLEIGECAKTGEGDLEIVKALGTRFPRFENGDENTNEKVAQDCPAK